MSSYFDFLNHHFEGFFIFCLAWVLSFFLASAVYRASRGKQVFAKAPVNPLFVERWTSGRSLKNFLTKIGGARNCLLVAVTPDLLTICPHFPFSLGFLPEIYGLDWKIPASAIVGSKQVSGILGKRMVIEFKDGRGGTQKVELMLRRQEQFEKAMSEMKRPI